MWVKKIPPDVFPNGWEILVQILHTYCTFLHTLDYKFLFSCLQLWGSYAISSATIHFTPYAQHVHHRPKRTLAFSDVVFSNSWEFLVHILHTYYMFPSTLHYLLFNYLQLWQSNAILSETTERAFRPMGWTFWAYGVNWMVALDMA